MKPIATTKIRHLFSALYAREKSSRFFDCLKRNLMISYASAEGASEKFQPIFRTEHVTPPRHEIHNHAFQKVCRLKDTIAYTL